MTKTAKDSVYDHFGLKLIDNQAEVVSRIEGEMADNGGIFILSPTFTARKFCKAGYRLKLHRNDIMAMDGQREIDERWFASTTKADNAELTLNHEGLSGIVLADGKHVIRLIDAVGYSTVPILGEELAQRTMGIWPMYSKFFDNWAALPLHIHHDDEAAALVNALGKPEAYFFPAQQNNPTDGQFAYTFFGFEPGTSKAQVLRALKAFHTGDNQISDLSRAYRLRVDTGWDVPPGVMHAPGSMCTYEPQKASDVFAMYERITQDRSDVAWSLLWKDTPDKYWKDGDRVLRPDEISDEAYQLLVDRLNWDVNVDPMFKQNRFMLPVAVAGMEDAGGLDEWICYKSDDFDAKRRTILPGQEVSFSDAGPYGFIVIQGHGTVRSADGPEIALENPAQIRYGELLRDEGYVTASAAANTIWRNPSLSEPLVALVHRGPGYADLDKAAVQAQNLKMMKE